MIDNKTNKTAKKSPINQKTTIFSLITLFHFDLRLSVYL